MAKKHGPIMLLQLGQVPHICISSPEAAKQVQRSLLLPREARERVKMNDGYYEIPAKSRVLVNAWAIERDPKYWNEPERFNPERFLESTIDYKGTHLEFIPFGGGRRMCPGLTFSLSSVGLALANLLHHFDWKLPKGFKPRDQDMSEALGVVVRRKNDLCLIATPYQIPQLT